MSDILERLRVIAAMVDGVTEGPCCGNRDVMDAHSYLVQLIDDLAVGGPTSTDAELEACRQELAVQVARAGAAEAALINRSDAAELQGRLRRIAEAQVRELDAEVRRLRALVSLEQRHPKTTETRTD